MNGIPDSDEDRRVAPGASEPTEIEPGRTFEPHRRDVERLAYRMLGTVADAEDIAQETWLRWHEAGEPVLHTPRAWLLRTCTRLCLDRLKSVQHQREQYIGEWLPEPLPADDPVDPVELDDTLSMALLTTIQRLQPAERAAFLLHDVFGYEFTEVAAILDREPANCRQLAVRARRHLAGERIRSSADRETVQRLSGAFFNAITSGDLAQLHSVLAQDVVLHSDGGGKVSAARKPIEGAEAVAMFFDRLYRGFAGSVKLEIEPVWFNGAPGALLFQDDVAVSAFQFHIVDGRILAVFVQRNPDKLARLASTTRGPAS